jgi:hypothetical protein
MLLIILILSLLLLSMSNTEGLKDSTVTTAGEFPHLLHKNGDEAVEIIKKQHPNINVLKVNQNSMMTMDFRDDRIRVIVDDNGIVIRPPRVG